MGELVLNVAGGEMMNHCDVEDLSNLKCAFDLSDYEHNVENICENVRDSCGWLSLRF